MSFWFTLPKQVNLGCSQPSYSVMTTQQASPPPFVANDSVSDSRGLWARHDFSPRSDLQQHQSCSALGPRWALCSKDILPPQHHSKKGEALLRTALRELYAFCVCCCGIKATVGHLIRSQRLHPVKLNRKGTKQKNLHLNTDFFVKIVNVTCFPLKWTMET